MMWLSVAGPGEWCDVATSLLVNLLHRRAIQREEVLREA